MHKSSGRRAGALGVLVLAVLLMAAAATAATDVWQAYASRFSTAAVFAAQQAEPVTPLAGDSLSAYRLGFAAGYDAAAQEAPGGETREAGRQMTYVLNKNTHKFHLPSCPSADQIKEANRLVFTGTRDEVVNRGYAPCQKCHP